MTFQNDDVDALRSEHFKESSTSTYAFCHKCGKPFPCLPIRAVDAMQDALDEKWDESGMHTMVLAMDQAVDEVLQQLAQTQGRLLATEELIARTRLVALAHVRPPMTYAGTPLREGAVPVSEILEALGPEPTYER